MTTEEAPTVVGGTTATKTKSQEGFESMHMSDPDIAKTWGSHTNASYGGLSHNHLILACRNIQAGMPGCECTAQQLAKNPEGQCKCNNKPILEETPGPKNDSIAFRY